MSEADARATAVWTEADYQAIDQVAPFSPESVTFTAQEILDRAKKRTRAWQQATEETNQSA